MSKPYNMGLVVGKFCPLHQGHEFVINTALANCEKVVLLSYTSEQYYTAAHRQLWLSTLFTSAIVIVPETGFPQDSSSALDHRNYCQTILKSLNLIPDAVFGSDDYIPDFAKHLGAIPVVVDQNRILHPVSGTDLRNGDKNINEWTSQIVQQSTGKSVLFMGAESSGKTTIARACALHYDGKSSWVPEFGREMWDIRNGKLEYSDMLFIAETQVHQEQAAMLNINNKFIFCDTSPMVTKFYSEQLFGKSAPQLDILAQRTYDLVFMCARDIPYEDDGTRAGVEFGNTQEQYYLSKLSNFVWLHGSVADRLASISNILDRL